MICVHIVTEKPTEKTYLNDANEAWQGLDFACWTYVQRRKTLLPLFLFIWLNLQCGEFQTMVRIRALVLFMILKGTLAVLYTFLYCERLT